MSASNVVSFSAVATWATLTRHTRDCIYCMYCITLNLLLYLFICVTEPFEILTQWGRAHDSAQNVCMWVFIAMSHCDAEEEKLLGNVEFLLLKHKFWRTTGTVASAAKNGNYRTWGRQVGAGESTVRGVTPCVGKRKPSNRSCNKHQINISVQSSNHTVESFS